MKWRFRYVVDLSGGFFSTSQQRRLERLTARAIAPAVRPFAQRLKLAAVQAWKHAIPIDTSAMRRAARGRASVRSRAGAVTVTISFTLAGGQQLAWNSLVARYRPDLRNYPVRYLQAQKRVHAEMTQAAFRAAQPVIAGGLNEALARLWRRSLKEAGATDWRVTP